ncbi:MAG: sulfatase-like hydrolase/transferase, partial [Planctomycetota bacterium]|nr:sulfatase-like hydrolase/transferase [Planctomycetota bacterium]
AQMDIHVGRVTTAIRRLGLEQNTLVLFTTDNGTSKRSLHQARGGKFIRRPVSSRIGGKLLPGGKGNLSDDGTHVPLLASWPGRIKPGTTTDHLVDMSDFLPTFSEIAGAPKSARGAPRIDGRSFAGLLAGHGGRSRRWAYAERGSKRFFVRTQNWKLYNDGKLFHASHDVNEKFPVPLNKVPRKAADDIKLLQQALTTIDDGHPFPMARTK